MKLSALFLVLALQVSATNYGQKVLNLQEENISLADVLKKIEKQSDYRFFYSNDVVAAKRFVSINVVNASLDEIMSKVLEGAPLDWKLLKNDQVVIMETNSENASVLEGKKRIITGTVKNDKGAALENVSVIIKGTSNGTVTSAEGRFSLDVNNGDILLFSSIGYESQEITVSNQETIDIILISSENNLNEVVVVGYGTQKKRDLTGAVVSLGEKDFTDGANTNALQLLNGRAAGVNISQTSSAPGAATKIQIRGAGSINSSNAALVVVDGLPGIDPTSINPDDIKSIEVLKDASAAAIYGTRAANGVVLITTKTGANAGAAVKFSAETGIQNVSKKIDVLDGRQYMETLNALRQAAGGELIYSQSQIDSVGAGTNWQDEVFKKNAPMQNYQLAVSGNGDKGNYYLGLAYYNQDGLALNSNFKKYNVRTNLNFTPTSFLRFKFNMNVTRTQQNALYGGDGVNENAGPINSAIQFDPTLPTGLNPATGRYYENNFISLDNPEALINGVSSENIRNGAYGTFTTEIEPVKDLVATIRLGGSFTNDMNSFYRDRSTMNGLASGGIGSKNGVEQTQWLAEFLLSYSKTFNNIHNLNLLAGTTLEQFMSQSVGANSRNFLSDITSWNLLQSGDNLNGDNVTSGKSRNRLQGIIGRINYSLKDRYLLTSSFRYDGTSRFSNQNKYAFFPSAALGWRISEESFFNADFVDELKLRASYGRLGNQGIDNYQTLQTLVAGGSAVFGDELRQGVYLARLPNPDVRWETTEEYNAGVDFSLFNHRLSGSVEYYVKNTVDQLFNKPLPTAVGFSSILVNAGNVQNRGWDIQLNSRNIVGNNFNWESSLNLSTLKNKVLELPSFIPEIITGSVGSFISNYQIVRVGQPLLSFYGYEVEGVFQQNDDIPNSAQPNAQPGYLKFKDQDGNGAIDADDRVILGKPFPDFTAGFNNHFSYKNFSLDFFMQWINGIQTLDANVLESIYPTNEYRNRIAKYYENRWTPDNPSNTYPSGVNYSQYGGAYSINSLTVLDASFFRMKTVTLSYALPTRKNAIVKSGQIYLATDNLFTVTKYEGFDPDASAAGPGSVSKVNYNSYPLARTIRLGFSVNF